MTGMETTQDEDQTAAAPEPEAQPEPTGAIEPARPNAGEVVAYDNRQRQILKSTLASDLSDDELDFALIQSERVGLDLFNRQMHVWKDWQGKLVMMTSIDGLRLVARRTGKYQGRSDIQWMGADGVWVDAWVHPSENPLAARCSVRHADDPEPITAVVVWAEFAQYTKNGDRRRLRKMWNLDEGGKPSLMLGKCAEALALRTAFPAELSGFYTEDEINTADELMTAAKADPSNRPSAESDEVKALAAALAGLPEEARAKVEHWWENSYIPKVLQQPFGQVGSLAEGALERFHPGSPHIEKVAELLAKAKDAVDGAGAPSTATAEPSPGPRETGPAPAAADGAPQESAPAPEAAPFTDLEATILDALQVLEMATGAEIAAFHAVPDNQGFKTELAALLHGDLIELVPEGDLQGREQGRGPGRIYRRNEPLLAAMDEPRMTENSDGQEATES